MFTMIQRAVLDKINALGHKLIRLSHPPLSLSMGDASLVGVSPVISPGDLSTENPTPTVHNFAEIDELLSLIEPWSGDVPAGYDVDFLGILTDGKFLWYRTEPFAGRHVSTSRPTLSTHGEGLFEIADWIVSTREARGRYVAISLGACFGSQLVGAWKALQAVNPLPSMLVAVEPIPENCRWIRSHMVRNGINPDDHWIIQAGMGFDNEPILFPVGAPGAGRNNCVAINSAQSRRTYVHVLRRDGDSERVLENILLHNSTGIVEDFGGGFSGEVKFVSAVTLRDVLSPFDHVDLLEVDIQQSEVAVFSPYMELVSRKVRRAHVGTHGHDSHDIMRALFLRSGWEIFFDYSPETRHMTERGPLNIGDGILSVRNPKFARPS